MSVAGFNTPATVGSGEDEHATRRDGQVIKCKVKNQLKKSENQSSSMFYGKFQPNHNLVKHNWNKVKYDSHVLYSDFVFVLPFFVSSSTHLDTATRDGQAIKM